MNSKSDMEWPYICECFLGSCADFEKLSKGTAWRRQEVAKLAAHFGLGRHVRGQVRISKFVKLWNVDWWSLELLSAFLESRKRTRASERLSTGELPKPFGQWRVHVGHSEHFKNQNSISRGLRWRRRCWWHQLGEKYQRFKPRVKTQKP